MSAARTPKRVLVVDDQADIRRLIRWTLEPLEAGLAIYEASTGQDALQMVSVYRPDLVLLDCMMPGAIDGFETCRQLKANEEFAGIKVILVSARGQRRDVDAGTEAGADAYIVKPFSPMRLVEQVEALLAVGA